MAKKKPDPIIKKVDAAAWMTSFSDLLTLMLTFFVLLLTMSSMDDQSFQEAFGMFNGAFGVLERHDQGTTSREWMVPISAPLPEILVDDLQDVIEKSVRELLENIQDKFDTPPEPRAYRELFEVVPNPRGVEVRIASSVLFDGRTAKLMPGSIRLLEQVALEVRSVKVQVLVRSWVPPLKDDRDEAWTLSLDRALAVVGQMTREIEQNRLSLMGFGRAAPRRLTDADNESMVTLTFLTED